MRDDLALNHVALLVIVDNDLVEFLVLCEEQIGVAEPYTTSGLGGKHVEAVPSTCDCKCAAAVVAATLEVAQLIDLGLALGVLWELNLIVYNVEHGAVLIGLLRWLVV